MPKEKTLREKADAGELSEEENREAIDALKAEAFEREQLTSRIRAAKDAKYNEELEKSPTRSSRDVDGEFR